MPEGSEVWELDGRFPEVLGEWRAKSRWTVLWGRPGRREDNILLLEARARYIAVQIGCSRAGAGGGRLLCLVDNMALCLSVGRSLARKFKLLPILRIIAGWSLAFGVSLSVRWVPSEYNMSDAPSRREEKVEQHPHGMSASTLSSHRAQCSPHVTDLHSVAPLQPHSSSLISKRENAKIIGCSSHRQCDGPSTCRAENSCSDSGAGERGHQKAPTDLDVSLRQERGGRLDSVARPGEGGGSFGGAAKRCEERFIAGNQHGVLGFRDVRKTASDANAMTARSRRRMRQLLEVHGNLGPAQSFFELRAVQSESAGLYKTSLRELLDGANQRKATRRVQRGGRRARRFHERQIFCRATSPRGRETHGGADVGGARVLQDRAPDHAQSVEVSAQMKALVPISIAKGGHGERADASGLQAHSSRPSSGIAGRT